MDIFPVQVKEKSNFLKDFYLQQSLGQVVLDSFLLENVKYLCPPEGAYEYLTRGD